MSAVLRRTAERHGRAGFDPATASALAGVGHPIAWLESASIDVPDDVRRALLAEADGFRTALDTIEDREDVRWLALTVSQRHAATARAGGALDAAAAFDRLVSDVEEAIAAARRTPERLVPPSMEVGPDATGHVVAPAFGAPDGTRQDVPPPASISWPGAPGPTPPPPPAEALAGTAPRRNMAVIALLGIPALLIIVLAWFLFAGPTGQTISDLRDGAPAATDAPAIDALDVEPAPVNAFREVVDVIADAENQMIGFQSARDDALAPLDADSTIEEVAAALVPVGEEAARRAAGLRAAVDALEPATRASGTGDLPLVVTRYIDHVRAWIAVLDAVAADPSVQTLFDNALFIDVNTTAEVFAPLFEAVVPDDLDADTLRTVDTILSGFQGLPPPPAGDTV